MSTANQGASRRVPTGPVTYLVGLVMLAHGVALCIRARLGVAPYDALTTGLAASTGWRIGAAAMVVPVVFIALSVVIGTRPGVGTVLAVFVVGPVLGLALAWLPVPDLMALRLGYWLLGFVILTMGVTALIVADVGPGPAELLMLALHDRGFRLDHSRTVIEVVAVAVAWFMGGEIGAGTLVFAVLLGPALRRTLAYAGFERPAPTGSSPAMEPRP